MTHLCKNVFFLFYPTTLVRTIPPHPQEKLCILCYNPEMQEFNFTISHQDLFPQRTIEKHIELPTRQTVRAVIFKDHTSVCVRTKNGSGFYFLPGGGIEDNETPIKALRRECLEEAGCNITKIHKIGTVLENRDEAKENRTNECFSAHLLGEQLEPTLAIGDEDGFEVLWIDIDEAISILKNQYELLNENTNNFYSRTFNTLRDLKILEALK